MALKTCLVLLALNAFQLNAQSIAEFRGVWRGVSPSEASVVRLGEIEITIAEEVLLLRMATGRGIVEQVLPLASLVPMRQDELLAEGVRNVGRVTGFRMPTGRPFFLFYRNPMTNALLPGWSEPGLIIRMGEVYDQMGPTVLLSPQQLERVSCARYLRAFELARGHVRAGKLPRLDSGGLAKF